MSNRTRLPWRVRLASGLALATALGLGTASMAATTALDDSEMAAVMGRDGIGFAVHVEMNSGLLTGELLNSRLVAGFNVDGFTTYALALNVGGIIDMFAMTLNLRTQPNGSDYMDLGLPFYLGVNQFGFRAFSVQADPSGPISNNYGQMLLNGHAAMQGHLYFWAQ